jgi:hypothetical protein
MKPYDAVTVQSTGVRNRAEGAGEHDPLYTPYTPSVPRTTTTSYEPYAVIAVQTARLVANEVEGRGGGEVGGVCVETGVVCRIPATLGEGRARHRCVRTRDAHETQTTRRVRPYRDDASHDGRRA